MHPHNVDMLKVSIERIHIVRTELDAAHTFNCELRRTGVLILLKTCENMWCSRFKLSKVFTIDATAKHTEESKNMWHSRLKLPKVLTLIPQPNT